MIYHQHISECDAEEVVGYCEGCEKPDAVLVDTYREYCEPGASIFRTPDTGHRTMTQGARAVSCNIL